MINYTIFDDCFKSHRRLCVASRSPSHYRHIASSFEYRFHFPRLTISFLWSHHCVGSATNCNSPASTATCFTNPCQLHSQLMRTLSTERCNTITALLHGIPPQISSLHSIHAQPRDHPSDNLQNLQAHDTSYKIEALQHHTNTGVAYIWTNECWLKSNSW